METQFLIPLGVLMFDMIKIYILSLPKYEKKYLMFPIEIPQDKKLCTTSTRSTGINTHPMVLILDGNSE